MKKLTVIVVSTLVLWLTSCNSLNTSVANQNGLVGQLHERFNSGAYEEIWSAAHPRFKGETDKVNFARYLENVRVKLGKAVSTANTERRFSTANQKTLVFLVQQTVFEKGRAIETFTIQMDGDHPTLLAYNVQSKLLDSR